MYHYAVRYKDFPFTSKHVSKCISNYINARISNHFLGVKPVSVILTVDPYIQKEQEIKLNCSSDVVPVGQTAEFLVNNRIFTNIRKHKWVCFNTKLNKTCSSGTCSCAVDRKSYVSTYQPMENVNEITFMCRMKFMGGTVKSSPELVVTIIGKGYLPIIYCYFYTRFFLF